MSSMLDRGWRVIVASEQLPGLDAAEQPRLVRIHVAASSDPVEPGDTIRMKAMLYPVPAQVIPGGRDMERELYFAGIGGVGYSLGPAHRTGEAEAAGGANGLVAARRDDTADRRCPAGLDRRDRLGADHRASAAPSPRTSRRRFARPAAIRN